MGKPTGFREYKRKTHGYQPAIERIKHFREFMIPLEKDELRTQAARCMDCGTPFCHPSCPLHNVIPDFNDHVYRGEWEEAAGTLLSTNNFPEFTGRVCPALCESGCVLGKVLDPVAIKNIELAIIETAWENGWMKPSPPARRTGEKVAVVGSGPAGLAAADQLNKAGHDVTVYERADRAGGLLRYGIPDFKLGKDIVQRRLDLMAAEGVVFKTGVNVGPDVPIESLRQEHNAVVLAIGSTIPRDLPIHGRDAKGVHFAMDFLAQSNKRLAGDSIPEGEAIFAKDKHVVVIGGGDTGSDCVGVSNRQGAASVTQLELLPRPPEGRTEQTPWPTHPGPRMFSTSTSHEEGCRREWSVLTKEFKKNASGELTGLSLVRIEWKDGKFTEIPGSDFELKADLCFLAMGFLYPDPKGTMEPLRLETDDRGNIRTDKSYQTSVEGVFACGDARRGQSLVVWAISEGREAAREVDKYLNSGASRLPSNTISPLDLSA
ncbi:MAG: glutamate synthase subunit beta [Candidatus Nitrospinota bacterium M3_3B_026]